MQYNLAAVFIEESAIPGTNQLDDECPDPATAVREALPPDVTLHSACLEDVFDSGQHGAVPDRATWRRQLHALWQVRGCTIATRTTSCCTLGRVSDGQVDLSMLLW